MRELLVAAGPPPLTVEAADCALDVIDFIAAAVRGADLIDVSPAVRNAWRSYLASYYPLLERSDRYWFVTAPWTMAAIRTTWPEMSDVDRNLYRREWAAALPAMLQSIGRVLYTAEALQAFPAARAGFPVSSGQDSISDLISRIHALQKQAEIDALAKGREAHLQMKLINDANNAAMLSNMSQMRYKASMGVSRSVKH